MPKSLTLDLCIEVRVERDATCFESDLLTSFEGTPLGVGGPASLFRLVLSVV